MKGGDMKRLLEIAAWACLIAVVAKAIGENG